MLDLSSIRCPDLSPRDVVSISEPTIKPPAGDLTKTKAQEWVDGLESQIDSKRRAGERVAWQYRRCTKSIQEAGS